MLSPIAQKQMLSYLYTEEEYRQFLYDDATGKTINIVCKGNPTIGLGWNLKGGIPKRLAEIVALYFLNDADSFLSHALDFYDSLNDPRKVVLCDMVFNMGSSAFSEFHDLINACRVRDWKLAEQCMLDSLWAKEVPKRSKKLGAMMRTGQWI